jgi:hypothetical protein
MEAIESSQYFLPVLSKAFVASPACRKELAFAVSKGWMGDLPKVIPLRLGRLEPEPLPTEIEHVQYLEMEGPDWFPMLCRQLELTQEASAPRLRFLISPAEVTAGARLPPIEVAVATADSPPRAGPPTVSVFAESGSLQGTTTRPVAGGVAVFNDLWFADAAPSTRLVATSSGHGAAQSDPFQIVPAAPVQPPEELARARRLATADEVRFLTDDRLLVLRPDRVELADAGGLVLAGMRLDGPFRFVRHHGQVAVVTTWSGRVLVASADGALSGWDLGRREGFAVPGDATVSQRHAEVGCWDGTVYRIDLVEPRQPERVLEDRAGVQALEAAAGRRYVHGMDGWLRAYEQGRLVAARELEPVVRLLKAFDQWLLVVGTGTLYRLSLDLDEVHHESLQSEVAGVLGGGDLPVVVCADGEGFRVDEQLAMLRAFRAAPGARPWSADQSGDRCTLVNADGSRSLVDGDRVVATHTGGTLAVSPSGELLAVGDHDGIAILPTPAFAASVGP